MSGILEFSNGALDRVKDPNKDATLTLTASGTLTDIDANTFFFGTRLEGDMLGANYNAVGGDVLGKVTQNNGTPEDFTGIFIAER